MYNFMPLGVIEGLADLAGDVLQVPDGKSFVARERGCNRVPLHVLRGGQQKLAFVADARQSGNVVAAERLGLFGFLENPLQQCIAVLQRIQAHHFQSDGLLTVGVESLIDGGEGRLSNLTCDFEMADLFCHRAFREARPAGEKPQ